MRIQKAAVLAAVVLSNTYATPAAAAQPVLARDGYVRIRVTLTVLNENEQHIHFDQCPDQPLFGEDMETFIGGEDDQGAVGIAVTAPDGFSATLTPISVNLSGGLFGFWRSCTTSVDRIIFQSPLLYVRANSGQSFHVLPVLTRSKSLDSNAIAAVDQLIDFAQPYINTTTAVAGQLTQAAKAALKGMSVSHKDAEGAYLTITADDPPPSKGWDIPGLLQNGKAVRIEAKLMPYSSLIEPPADGHWSPDTVLNTSYPVNPSNGAPSPGGTLGRYFEKKYSAHISTFQAPATIDGASGACGAIDDDSMELALSARDRALLIWALVHAKAAAAISTNAALDTISCISKVKSYLPSGLLQQPGRPASEAQMSHTVYVGQNDESLYDFFTLATWDEKSGAGPALFSYETPLTFSDLNSLMFSNTQMSDNTAWLALRSERDGAYLSHLGCYLFIPYRTDQPNLASKIGSQSIMLAVGALPGSAPGKDDGKELALTFSFAPATADVPAAKISRIDVSNSFSDEAHSLLRAAFRAKPAKHQCSGGWKPRLLFGN